MKSLAVFVKTKTADQRECKADKPYILSGKLYCGYCNTEMTAETGTSKTGNVYHYYKCYKKKLHKDECSKKNVKREDIEDLVFSATMKYVLQPNVIEKVAKIIVEKFNSEITKPTTLITLEASLRENTKAINGIMTAIEQGIITSTTKERLLELEAQKTDLENKIAIEQAKQLKPLNYEDVKRYINYFAHKKYEKGEEKNEFFNSFINRVILFDDKAIIIYNTSKEETRELKLSEQKQIIKELCENDDENKKNSLESKKFKRVSLGGVAIF